MKKINFVRLLFIFLTILLFASISFIAAWAKDEGTLGDGVIKNVCASTYNLFRFPTLSLFENYFKGNLYFIGLLINCLLLAFAIELFSISFRKTRKHR